MNFLSKALNKVFEGWVDQALNFITEILALIGGAGIKVLDLKIVNDGIIYAQTIAFVILGVKALHEILFNYILRENGDPDADLGGAVINIAKSVAIISTVPWITKYVYTLGTSMATDVANLDGKGFGGIGKDKSISGLFDDLMKIDNLLLFILFAALITAILVVIVVIQASIRAAELAFIAVAGCFMAIGLVNSSSEMYASWWRELVSISITQVAQIFLVKLAFEAMQMMAGGKDGAWMGIFLLLGTLWVAIKSPTIVKQFTHSTGVGRVAGGAAQQFGSAALMRKMMMR